MTERRTWSCELNSRMQVEVHARRLSRLSTLFPLKLQLLYAATIVNPRRATPHTSPTRRLRTDTNADPMIRATPLLSA